MTENLNKKPPKGILKTSSSFDTASTSSSPPCGASGTGPSCRRNSGVAANNLNTSCASHGHNDGDCGSTTTSCPIPMVASNRNELTVDPIDDDGGGGGAEAYVHVRKHS